MTTLKSLLLLLSAAHLLAAAEKPNILFIYLDDFGWKDSGFMGTDFYETPHLARAEGMELADSERKARPAYG